MRTVINRIFEFVTNRPIKTLVLLLLVTLFLGGGLSQLKIDNNQESELPKDNEIVATNERLDDVFGEKGIILIGIKNPDSIYNQKTLILIDEISEAIKSIPFVISDEVTSLSTFQNLTAREWGLERDPFLKQIPNSKEAMRQLKEDVIQNDEVYGRLVSKDGTFVAISAYVEEGYNQTQVTNAVFDLVSKYQNNDLEFFVAGDAIQAQEIDSGIQKDTGILLPSALALILICFLLALRTMRGVILPFSVVVLSIIWTMGAMGWLGLAVTVVSSALPALMVAVASSYGIHVMIQYYEQVNKGKSKKQASAEAIKNISPAIILTGATSALGALTLIVFKVTSIQEFGLATAIGVLSATVLSIVFIPAWLSILKPTAGNRFNKIDRKLDSLLSSITTFSLKHRHLMVGTTIIALSASVIFGLSQLKYGQDFIEYFEPEHRLRIAFEEFNNQLGGARYMDVMIEAPTEDGMQSPLYLKQVAQFQDYAESLEHVGYSLSFADVIKRINSAMHENKQSYERIPDDESTIAQYQLLYSMSGNPGDQSNLIDYPNQRLKIRIMLTTSEQEDHKALYKQLKQQADKTFDSALTVDFGGDVMFWLAQIQYIVEGKVWNIIASVIVVFLFCSFIFKSGVGGILSIIPLSIATLITLSMMGFLGIRLDVGTAIVTAIGVGIGVDFTIHYLKRLLQEYRASKELSHSMIITSQTAGKAVLYDTISNVAGFSVFILSGFQPLQFFGWLISLMMISSALATLIIFPSVISLIGKPLLNKQETNIEVNTDNACESIN
ncbi:RND family transporter [Bermanella marisrubri]|uniref:SSD domain-containing protein n=1 Tax=Bermanella marisrubri TaxID=207949 RepID=Q1MY55_9GAMM|nr:MMPL family transporter [Bermanella marisrubri]EAT10905.1 hypothetical protein RED65_12680 [Oceanobacter sp. RED65] [Bermanella marisrubri]QIZ85328.1 RND family transporter [Bermanella marisrubri]